MVIGQLSHGFWSQCLQFGVMVVDGPQPPSQGEYRRDLFVQCRDKTHQPLFTSQIIGYLNSIIIIIMVTAAINANDCLDVQTRTLKRKKLEANRG